MVWKRLWRGVRTNRVLAAAFSLLIHVALLVGFIAAPGELVPSDIATPVTVTLVDSLRSLPTGEPPAAAVASTRDLHPLQVEPAPTVPRALGHEADEIVQMATETTGTGVSLTESQLSGAVSADAGPLDSACDMARRVQSALRKDHIVLSATTASAGQTLLVWNGDWVQGPGEEGKGMAAVREAIMWEVAFAPKECRTQPAQGLILMSLTTQQGRLRLALGSGNWRWSDLLR